MNKRIVTCAVLLGGLFSSTARADWSNELTSHQWDATDVNSNGWSDCGQDVVDGRSTPGRTDGGWFEWRFEPPGGQSALGNYPNMFLALGTDKAADRVCPKTFNEYTANHMHGVRTARFQTYSGKIFAAYDTVGGYFWANKIKIAQNPADVTSNWSGSLTATNPAQRVYTVLELARNPRGYIDTYPGSPAYLNNWTGSNYGLPFDYGSSSYLPGTNTPWQIEQADGCDQQVVGSTAVKGQYNCVTLDGANSNVAYDAAGRRVNGHTSGACICTGSAQSISNGTCAVVDVNWKANAGVDQENTLCAPPAVLITADPDFKIRADNDAANLTPMGFVVWLEGYVENVTASSPLGADPNHRALNCRQYNNQTDCQNGLCPWDSTLNVCGDYRDNMFPYRPMHVHVQQINAATALVGANYHTSSPATTPLTPNTETGLYGYANQGTTNLQTLPAFDPHIAILREAGAYHPFVVFQENSYGYCDWTADASCVGNYPSQRLYPNGWASTYVVKHYDSGSGNSVVWDDWGTPSTANHSAYGCNWEEVSSGRATGRKSTFKGVSDAGTWVAADGTEEPLIAGLFMNTSWSSCDLWVVRRDHTSQTWVDVGSAVATGSSTTSLYGPRLTVYKNMPFVSYVQYDSPWPGAGNPPIATGHGYVHAASYGPTTGGWSPLDANTRGAAGGAPWNYATLGSWNWSVNGSGSSSNSCLSGTGCGNLPLTRGASIAVTSATAVAACVGLSVTQCSQAPGCTWNSSTSVCSTSGPDPTVNVYVAYNQNAASNSLANGGAAGEAAWGTAVAMCTAQLNASGAYSCNNDPLVYGAHRRIDFAEQFNYDSYYGVSYPDGVGDDLAYPNNSTAWNFYETPYGHGDGTLGVAAGARVEGTLPSYSTTNLGTVTPALQQIGYGPEAADNYGNPIHSRPGYTDLVSDQAAATWDGQPNLLTAGWTGVVGDHRNNDRGVFAKTDSPKIGAKASISSSYHTIAAMGTDNFIYAWGYNAQGQLGNNSTANSLVPVKVQVSAANDPIVMVTTGAYHSGALTKSGKLYLWGYNYYGQLCNGTTNSAITPQMISGNNVVVDFSLGGYHTVMLLANGAVLTCGYNGDGELGNSSTNSSPSPVALTWQSAGNVAPANFNNVTAGLFHSCATNPSGTWCWGYNAYGQLGNNSTTSSSFAVEAIAPPSVNGVFRPSQIVAGGYHTVAFQNYVYSWGYNGYGQLANNTTTDAHVPTMASCCTNYATHGETIYAGTYNTVYHRHQEGAVWIAGRNAEGELGNGNTTNSSGWTGVLIRGNPGWVDTIGAGPNALTFHAVTSEKKRRDYTHWQCWGYNGYGECGNGNGASSYTSPVAEFYPPGFGCSSISTTFQIFRSNDPQPSAYGATSNRPANKTFEDLADFGDLYGCGGRVTWPNRATLCASNTAAPASALYWSTFYQRSGGVANYPVQAPINHYWTDTNLSYGGSTYGNCWASSSAGSVCPGGASPMHICSGSTASPVTAPDGTTRYQDAFGNTCGWQNCTDASTSYSAYNTYNASSTTNPGAYYGGCGTDDATAGTLCFSSALYDIQP